MRRLVASLAGLGLVLLAAAPVAGAQSPADLCSAAKAGTQCQPGNNRQTAGGGDKASHEGWPAISGVFWKVLDGDHLFVGGAAQRRAARAPRQRRHPRRPRRRRDLGRLGPGRQRARPARPAVRRLRRRLDLHEPRDQHVRGGSGDDVIWAFYGKGTVDCGPGYDRVRKRYSNRYRFKNCEATLG